MHSEEHRAALDPTATISQVCDHRLAHVGVQGETIPASPIAADHQLAVVPVEVL